jgi:hypothetical protein
VYLSCRAISEEEGDGDGTDGCTDGRTVIRMFRHGEFHDQADAKWIVIRGQLRDRNDMPIGRPGVGHPQGVFGGFSYY